MSVARLSPWDREAPEPRWRRFVVSLGHLDRAEAAAAQGDRHAAAHFFRLAEMEIDDAVCTAEAVNGIRGIDGVARLVDLARRYVGLPEPSEGYGIDFRVLEDGDAVSVWLTLGRVGPSTGALLPD
ncbi:hypothetical protein GXW78_13910 [Roseomonas terrae]|jgi:hypothetical protein|uniref:Uncharacterized protein n=1 Tax=Neoroseomonas terrae TaxID=424799 RepID=A0ABS5EIE1_9PROT|nr:hypothetical protein [Neoroseomonas terrae]MBR0650768.1 hypothetical protein [Neoroseomonas terrae]